MSLLGIKGLNNIDLRLKSTTVFYLKKFFLKFFFYCVVWVSKEAGGIKQSMNKFMGIWVSKEAGGIKQSMNKFMGIWVVCVIQN